MSKKKISFGVIVGAISLAVDSLSGLVVLPILLKFLSKELAGLWVFFLSFTALINLAQAGLGPVVIRKSAELKESAQQKDIAAFYKLINASYSIVAALVFVICVIIYFAYILWVLQPINFVLVGSLSWAIIALGYAVRIYSVKNYHIVNGFGEVGWDKVAQIVVSIVNLILFYLVLNLGYGIVGVSTVFLISNFIHLFASVYVLNKFTDLAALSASNKIKRTDIIDLFSQSGKMLLLNLVGFIVMNTDIFIVERMFGLKTLPYFSALAKIVWLIIAVASLFLQMVYPYIAINWAQKNFMKCRRLYISSVQLALGIGIVLSIISFYLAPYIVPKWVGIYLGPSLFSLQLLFGLIYIHHVAHANAVIATNSNAFILPAIANALLSLPLSIAGGYYWGLNGIIIGNIAATVIPSFYVVLWSYRFFREIPHKEIKI